MSEMITIDEAITKLQAIKKKAHLGGGSCLVLSLTGSGITDAVVNDIVLEQNDDPADGSIAQVRVEHPELD